MKRGDNISDRDKDILIKKLTDNLKQLRAMMDISQEQLANIIGVSRQTINAIESGRREMHWMMFVTIILFFLKDEEVRSLLTFMGIYTPELANFLDIDSDNFGGRE